MSSGESRGDRQLLEDLQERLRTALDDRALLTRCAWCDRYQLGDRWLAVPRSLLAHGLPASHGICPDCVDELRRAGRSH